MKQHYDNPPEKEGDNEEASQELVQEVNKEESNEEEYEDPYLKILRENAEKRKEDERNISKTQQELNKKYEEMLKDPSEGGMKKQYHGTATVSKGSFKGAFLSFLAMLGVGVTGVKGANTPPEDTASKKLPTEFKLTAAPKETKKANTASFAEGVLKTKEGLSIRAVSPEERVDWNNFLEFVKQQGYQGSEKLNKGSDALARKLFADYKKLHPETTLDYSIVASVQHDMQQLKEEVQAFAKRRNDPNAENLMNRVSKIDGWFGSETSRYGYLPMFLNTFKNDKLMSKTYLGLVDGTFTADKKTTGAGVSASQQKIPKGAKIETLADGDYYENADGDLVKILK